MTNEPAVLVEGIEKSFGATRALNGVSFEAHRGEVLGVLGPNGAGKTTAVNVLSTLIRPDRGRAVVAGHDVVADAAAVRGAIMLTGQYAALDESLTGNENLVMFGRLLGLRKRAARARASELLAEFALEHAADRRVGTYSGGMRRRIDIACGLVVRPEVVFLDEPTTGLDPRSRQGVWDLVASLKQMGITTLLTTQYLEGGGRAERSDHRHRPRQGHRRGHRRRTEGTHRRQLLRGGAAADGADTRDRRRARIAAARRRPRGAARGR